MAGTASLFELGAELARIHARSSSGTITVIPIVVDDFDQARHIIAALSAMLTGEFIDTAAPELQLPVVATDEPLRRAAVTTALALPGGGKHVVLVDAPNGELDATFDPPIGPEPSAGDAAVLALARAVTKATLDRHEFAAIAYEESTVDVLFRDPTWRLAVDQLSEMPNPTLRTLVVIVGATIDISRHCQTDRGFRLGIENGRLLRRQRRDDLVAKATQISRSNQPAVFFLGAGFAASSRLPLGNVLRDNAIRRLLSLSPADTMTSHELATRFHDWISAKPGWLTERETNAPIEFVEGLTLERVIAVEQRMYSALPTLDEFRQHHDAVVGNPGPAVVNLCEILKTTSKRIVLAGVNFDLLIERCTTVPLRVFSSEDDFREAPEYLDSYFAGTEDAIPLLKFHGSIEDPASCVVSVEQTDQGVGDAKLHTLRALLGDDADPRPWVYVGVSMRDRDLLPVLVGPDFARRLDEMWVLPYLTDTVEPFMQDRLPIWSRSGPQALDDRLITETADSFFGALAEVWDAS